MLAQRWDKRSLFIFHTNTFLLFSSRESIILSDILKAPEKGPRPCITLQTVIFRHPSSGKHPEPAIIFGPTLRCPVAVALIVSSAFCLSANWETSFGSSSIHRYFCTTDPHIRLFFRFGKNSPHCWEVSVKSRLFFWSLHSALIYLNSILPVRSLHD